MDPEMLATMLELIDEQGYRIDSLSVIRNGYLVLDFYFAPFKSGELHIVHSCTKSVVSTLIGIAIQAGYIESIDVTVLDFFPDKDIQNIDPDKRSITLGDLLIMGSGIRCRDSYLYDWQGLREMMKSPDWVEYFLSLPMEVPPGSKFEYCNSGSYTLSAILQETTGMTTLQFARQYLFDPLGIQDVDWPESPEGINYGWGEMSLNPHDMAKIGYLYLNGGRWAELQVIPETWVEAATSPQIHAGTLSDDYGYQWWVDRGGYYMALGYAGQYIIVVPDQELVVVFTSDLPERDFFVPEILFNDYILPAIQSETGYMETHC